MVGPDKPDAQGFTHKTEGGNMRRPGASLLLGVEGQRPAAVVCHPGVDSYAGLRLLAACSFFLIIPRLLP